MQPGVPGAGAAPDGASVEIRPIWGYREFQEALAVRIRVFVTEQGGPLREEPDEWDAASRHFVALCGGRIVGTARLLFPVPGTARIGRVAVLPEWRGQGLGAALVEEVVRQCRALGAREVVLDAQQGAIEFYTRLGFAAEGEPFLDSGIPHRRMRRALDGLSGGSGAGERTGDGTRNS